MMHKHYLLTFIFTLTTLFLFSSTSPLSEDQPKQWISAPYPNPAKDYTSFEYRVASDTYQAEIRIYNLIGKKIQSKKLSLSSGKITLRTNNLKAGVYLVYLVVANKPVSSRKLVIF